MNVARGVDTRTPLQLALLEGYEKAAELLLSDGEVDITAGDVAAYTPLQLLSLRGCARLVKQLLVKPGQCATATSGIKRMPRGRC